MGTCSQSLYAFGRIVSEIAGIDEDDPVSNEQLLIRLQ